MNKAFDTIMQTEVDAEDVAKITYYIIGHRFRYQCLCCGEEVYLAAADSTIKSPHFRHRRGNNDIDCERYLGQPGAIEHYVSLRKKTKEYIGFCFNMDYKTFEVCIKLLDEEINDCATDDRRLSLFTKFYSEAFFTIPINRSNMIPNISNYFMLDKYANDYYVSINTNNSKKIYRNIMKRESKLNIYKVNQLNNHYKRNTSDIIYTNYWYIAVSEKEDNITALCSLKNVESEEEPFSFTTQERQFYAVKFTIHYSDYLSGIFFQKHDIKVENSEYMNILWPPVFKKDSVSISESNKMYVSSSFELVPHGNVAANKVEVHEISLGVYEFSFTDRAVVCEKNVECEIVRENQVEDECSYEEPNVLYTDIYNVLDDYEYYLFDKNGCTPLSANSKVYLSDTDKILGYRNGHIKVIVLAKPKKEIDKVALISDAVKYYPQEELFDPDDFMEIELDETVLSYIETCYRRGKINTIIKQYIKEGRI